MSDESQGPGWWQASDGKWYPPQPPAAPSAPPPPMVPPPAVPQKRRHGCLAIVGGATILLIVLIIVIVILIAVGTKTTSTGSKSLGGPAPKASYKVGDTAKTSDFQVTVYGFKDPQPPTDTFNTPKAGNHFVSVDVQVTNPGKDQQTFSSLIGFHLLDADNRQYDETIAGLSPSAPDGQIAGGQSIRGFVVFEVPDGTTGLKFRAQGSFTAAGAVWTLS